MPLYFAHGFTRCYCDELIGSTAQVANRKIVSNNPCVCLYTSVKYGFPDTYVL
jgi:hypothetical protein